MAEKERGRDTATPSDSSGSKSIPSRIKTVIVRLAVMGLIPLPLAAYLIRRFRLGAA